MHSVEILNIHFAILARGKLHKERLILKRLSAYHHAPSLALYLMPFLGRNRPVLDGLRLFWTGLSIWYAHETELRHSSNSFIRYEYGVFIYSVRKCSWPDSEIQATRTVNCARNLSKHLLIERPGPATNPCPSCR